MNTIKSLYVVHHSHTDIGYTDLQERIIDCQVSYIESVIKLFEDNEDNFDFRWNCETYFCIEQFLQKASEVEKQKFFKLVREKKIGISATYLNFNDLLDTKVVAKRTKEMKELFSQEGIELKTAMNADINGISMGQRDAMLQNGVEFLFTNIHTHHGMYPLYQNQNAFYWENKSGQKLLVWNGEHYNLGNALGLKPNTSANFMTQNYFGEDIPESDLAQFKNNLDSYIKLCEENGYPYDFIISSVSGVFSDNAPPNTEILNTIHSYQNAYPDGLEIKMVSLYELYELIKEKLTNAPVYKGDLNDWWANGVGSTPYAVKHYKEAQKLYHLCEKLDPEVFEENPVEARATEDNLLLYAEHTWGHSSSITNPYDTMVLNLDMRKNSYASKAHENASLLLNRTAIKLGDTMRYYNTNGRIKVINTTNSSDLQLVEFYIESHQLKNCIIINADTKEEIKPQLSSHPRGICISFTDRFKPDEQKVYDYKELPAVPETHNSRIVYIGSERVKDITNQYDKSYLLPYELENDWFKIKYNLTDGITSFYHKKEKHELLEQGYSQFFTPIYERTPILTDTYEERRLLGRNIRGKHAILHQGKLTDIKIIDKGTVFTTIELVYQLEGTIYCSVVIKIYEQLPKIDFKLKIGKTLSQDIESVYLPLALQLPSKQTYIQKGSEPFRPGIDQIPGTGMEYYMSDYGIVYTSDKSSILINTFDTPLLYMGDMKHHPIHLCDQNPANNNRPVYSWIMNNTWETNFKIDLSGFSEFCYSLTLEENLPTDQCFEKLENLTRNPYTLIIE